MSAASAESTLNPNQNLTLVVESRYMAPEALSSEVFPASDMWAAGVMAYQLLCGFLPFDDARNRESPALSQACTRLPMLCRVWKRTERVVGVPCCQSGGGQIRC